MPSAPALTYRGALRLLGSDDSRVLKVLDVTLGGLILAAGPWAYTGAQAASFLWGAVDHKNEAIGMFQKLVDAGVARLSHTSGRKRFELLEAAHTTIVGAAFFDAWRDELRDVWDELDVSKAEQVRLLTGNLDDDLVRVLCTAEIPMPSAAGGFSRAMEHQLRPYLHHAAEACLAFFSGLAAGEDVTSLDEPGVAASVVEKALARYREYYLRLATDVREFLVWATLGGQDALGDSLGELRDSMYRRLDRQEHALAALTALLELPGRTIPAGGKSELLRQANAAVLSRPPVPDNVLRYVPDLRMPSVEDSFVTPHYQVVENGPDIDIADDEQWRSRLVHNDLETFFAAYFGSPMSTSAPLLVLGDPGSGKSTLSKALAARLPADRFLVIRVPLRDVTADEHVHTQIEEALDNILPGRVQWHTLADESRDIVRVVIFDGLDELIQSVGVGRRYLREIEDFQAKEAAAGSPVSVVVTSRTLVMGRTWVPKGCLVIKLAEFTDDQVRTWLTGWHDANARMAAAGTVRLLDFDGARQLPELTRQPLLLLLIALYVADPQAPPLAGAQTSSAALYQRLIENFVRREIDQGRQGFGPDELDGEVARRRWQLGLAAVAMFNRRRTYVLDGDLTADLAAFSAFGPTGGADDVIGQFFFVHAAAATVPARIERRKSFEFLHSTLGEFLLADTVLDEFLSLCETVHAPRRHGYAGQQHIDDDLLFALLAHRAIPAQPRSVAFLVDLVGGLPDDVRAKAVSTGIRLLEQAKLRSTAGKYANYLPQDLDPVRNRAAYTANLTLLLACLGGVKRDDLAASADDAVAAWQSMVRLWHAGLDDESWSAVLGTLALDLPTGRVDVDQTTRWFHNDLAEPRLLGDERAARAIELALVLEASDDSAHVGSVRRSLLSVMTTRAKRSRITSTVRFVAEQVANHETRYPASLRQLMIDFLALASPSWPYEEVREITKVAASAALERVPREPSVKLVIDLTKMDYRPLALTAAAFPQLLTDIPDLAEIVTWSSWGPSPVQLTMGEMAADPAWYERVRASQLPADDGPEPD
ncbi:hypothetical protein [Dactylosporangium salmoneum]